MEELEKNWCEKTKEQSEQQINNIIDDGITCDNIDYLGKLVDIHKDLENEEYWKEKIDMYRDDYGMYGRRARDSRGRYMDSYSRGDMRGGRRYAGHEMLDEVGMHYSDYMDSGMYGTEGKEKIGIMLDALGDFIHRLKKEAKTPEEHDMIERKLDELGRM